MSSGHFKPLWLLMTLNGPKQLNGPKGRLLQPATNDFWFFFMDFYVGRPCENFRRIQSYTILECKKRGHWRPFEIQLCAAALARRPGAAPPGGAGAGQPLRPLHHLLRGAHPHLALPGRHHGVESRRRRSGRGAPGGLGGGRLEPPGVRGLQGRLRPGRRPRRPRPGPGHQGRGRAAQL